MRMYKYRYGSGISMRAAILLGMVFLLIACAQQTCTEEAKLCPDGSSVGRTGPNCEFAPCQLDVPVPVGCTKELKICLDGSTVGRTGVDCAFAQCPSEMPTCNYDDPAKPYTFQTVGECAVSLFTCARGYVYFSDSCGCGCRPIEVEEPSCDYDNPTKSYVRKSVDECARIRFMCAEGKEYFSDDCGCGCQSAPAQHACDPAGSSMTLCTMEYAPVCGWYKENIQCIKYPCAQTFSNDCAACQNEHVAHWTDGECPI